MNEITIPFHLAIPTAIGVGALLTIFIQRKLLFENDWRKWLWVSASIFFVIYILIVGSATIGDIYYQWDLNSYDLNKDGFFGGRELTSEQEAAMQRLTNDVGRNFTFITGLFFSGIISLFVLMIGKAYWGRGRN